MKLAALPAVLADVSRRLAASSGLLVVLVAGCVAARPVELAERARSTLAEVQNTSGLADTVHRDPRVLDAIGMFLRTTDARELTDEELCAGFSRLMPHPPWDWNPAVDFRRIGSGRYLVAVGHAAATQPSSLYLFEGRRHVPIDSGTSGLVQIERVDARRDRIDVTYYPTPSGGAPRLKFARLERDGTTWRVDRNVPDPTATALLDRIPPDDMERPDIHRDPRLLEALGVFLASAGPLHEADLNDHMRAAFPDTWYRRWPIFDIRRVGPTRYLVIVGSADGGGRPSSRYLFDGASYVIVP